MNGVLHIAVHFPNLHVNATFMSVNHLVRLPVRCVDSRVKQDY